MVQLKLKAKHFKTGHYMDVSNCPVAQAAKEQFNADECMEGTDKLDVHISGIKTTYDHKEYGYGEYKWDRTLARIFLFFGWENLRVRKLKLTILHANFSTKS